MRDLVIEKESEAESFTVQKLGQRELPLFFLRTNATYWVFGMKIYAGKAGHTSGSLPIQAQ
jgi:hypothetical protein